MWRPIYQHPFCISVGLFKNPELDGSNQYYFSEISHALNLLKGLNRQRQERTLCDVIICVEDQEFSCHRNVLAACSPYFLAMFSGKNCDKLYLLNTGMHQLLTQHTSGFWYWVSVAMNFTTYTEMYYLSALPVS